MAWTWISQTVAIGVVGGVSDGTSSPDAGEKAGLFAAVVVPQNQAQWWQQYVWDMRQEFARRLNMLSPNVSNLKVTATGLDQSGIGTLTITLTTS